MTDFFYQKKVVVLGGSEGIGQATARSMVQKGAHVCIGSRHPEKLTLALSALEQVRQDNSQRLTSMRVDVTDENVTQQGFKDYIDHNGAPDILVNAAGFAYPGYLDEMTADSLRRMMDLNYFGIVHAVKAVLPSMRHAGTGNIVNVSSMAGYLGLFGYTGYCASKYAVIGFSDALRQEVRPYGIYVSVICPPNTQTPGLENENRIKPKELLAMEEKVSTVSPEVIARAIIRALPHHPFLIHPTAESRWVYYASRWMPSLVAYALRRPARI